MSKLMSLSDAATLVQNGQTLSIGGTFCQRVPAAFVRELARRKLRDLKLIKPSPGYDLDLLAAAGCVTTVRSGIVGLEPPFGMAPNFRRAVEEGRLEVVENACATVMASLQAAAFGVPFQPVAGLDGSDIPKVSGFARVKDPYSEAEVYVVPAVQPDWAIIHVAEADERGNARIYGSPVWDRLMSRAARRVIVTAEKILPTAEFAARPELTTIPELFVAAVVHAANGAAPGACYPYYDTDEAAMRHYLDSVRAPEGLARYLAETRERDAAVAREAA